MLGITAMIAACAIVDATTAAARRDPRLPRAQLCSYRCAELAIVPRVQSELGYVVPPVIALILGCIRDESKVHARVVGDFSCI